jgi:hypothetical protein
MKLYFSSVLAALVLFFAPIGGIILIVALSSVVDTCFGMWRAYCVGEKVSSKIFRHGFVPKLLSYIAVVMLVYSSDVFILNALTQLVVSVDFLATKLIALVLICIEVKSMDESFVAVKGYSFIGKAQKVIDKFKDIKKELKTIK